MTRANQGLGGDSYTLRLRRARGREGGASVVEFALVVPLLLMLVFGIIEFGIVMAQKATVASAAREGARFGSVNLYASAMGSPRDCAEVIARTRENAVTLGMSPSDLAVTVSRGSDVASATAVCNASANGLVTGAGANAEPCDGADAMDVVYVQTSFGARLSIPLVASTNIPLDATGASRCEYN